MSKHILSILAYGRGWVAIDKPYNLSVHNAESSISGSDVLTLANDLLAKDPILCKEVQPEKGFFPAPVHRLDVGTSGVLLLALTHNHARQLAEALSKQTTEKIYTAILKGKIESDIEWAMPLTEKSEGRRDPAGSGPKKPCRTHVHPLRYSSYFSLCEVTIETGRTHQIRRHAALAKHPVIGDTRYGNPDYAKKIAEIYGVDRMALHASKLGITIDEERWTIESPQPDAFKVLMATK